MDAFQIYIIISIAVLAIIAILVFFINKKKKEQGLTPLAKYAFIFVIAGILFGDNWMIGYSLLGIGIILAVIDIVMKLKK
jgi:heme/copper-type cytochrome/quinol oxidase subunit 4